MEFTDTQTKNVFSLMMPPTVFDNRATKFVERRFNKLIKDVGGKANVVFAPPSTKEVFANTGKLYKILFNENKRFVGIESAFWVKDISLVLEEYKDQVEVFDGDL